MERETGVEPATSTLARWRSTTELFPLGDAKARRIAKRPYGIKAPAVMSVVPPQCAQIRTTVAPSFRSGAQSSQSGRSVSWHRKWASRSVCVRQQRGGVLFEARWDNRPPGTVLDPGGYLMIADGPTPPGFRFVTGFNINWNAMVPGETV